MKTTNLFLTAILALALSSNLFAKGDNDPSAKVTFEAAVVPTQNDAVIFRCTNNVYDKLMVKVYDSEGNLLNSKYINTMGNIKLTYKTNELPAGTFSICVYNKHKKIYGQSFNLTSDHDFSVALD